MTTNTNDIMREIGPIAGENPREENGWQRQDVWAGGQAAGDESLQEFSARYEHEDGRVVELTYFVSLTPYVVDDVSEDKWGVELMMWNARRDGEDYIDDEYDYDYGDYRFFDTPEDAARVARARAIEDEAWKFGA